MKRFAGVDTSVLKQHYEKKVQDLEQEKRKLQVEVNFIFLFHAFLGSILLLTYSQYAERD